MAKRVSTPTPSKNNENVKIVEKVIDEFLNNKDTYISAFRIQDEGINLITVLDKHPRVADKLKEVLIDIVSKIEQQNVVAEEKPENSGE